jgi:hypothetical protein
VKNLPTISVTVSVDLLAQLRQVAREQNMPLRWIVAGLVCDTIVAWDERAGVMRSSQSRAIRAFRPPVAGN